MVEEVVTKRKPKRKKSVIILLILAIIMLLLPMADFFVDWMWFGELGYVSVFFKQLVTELIMGAPLFVILFFITNIYLRKIKQRYMTNIESDVEPDRGKMSLVTNIISAIFSGALAYMAVKLLWFDWLQFTNVTDFGIKDPVFGHDVSFYIFRMDFLKELDTLLISGTLFYMVLTAAYYIWLIAVRRPKLFEEVTPDGPTRSSDDRPSWADTPLGKKFGGFTDQFGDAFPNIRRQRRISRQNAGEFFSIVSGQVIGLAFIFFILLGFDFVLRQYGLLNAHNGIVYGAGFTSVTVVLWMFRILAVLSFIAAFTTGYFLKKKQFKKLMIIPVAMGVVLIAGILLNIIVQSYIVAPDELNKESKYLKRNIEFTQHAYQLKDVTVKDFSSANSLDAKAIEDNSQTISNVRINDYNPVNTFYNQTQSIRQYYTFNDVDVDRYTIDGELTQTYLATREIDEGKISNTWLNRHIKYTHGYGVTLSRVDTVTKSGQPDVLIKNIPPESSVDSIRIDEPRLYFGELTNEYSLVDTNEDEFDYPDGDHNKYTRYDGKAGIRMSLPARLMFALKEKSLKLLVSTNVKSSSKILINRNVVKRVEKIFPFLVYEQDPYCVSVDGKLYWIVDAYTTSRYYPYSEPYTGYVGGVNYIKNSVKIVVDAYNGTTDYYVVDQEDPIAKTYQKIYPKLFKNGDEMPEGIREHIRYPGNLFEIQAGIYTRYHMNNVKVFYQQEDTWDIANEIYGTEQQQMTSNYYIAKLPGEKDAEFINSLAFTPKSKQNMTALMIARNDGEDYGKLVLYRFPKSKTIYGPMQVEAQIDQHTEIARDFSLWSQAGSTYSRGNMFVVPVNDSLLYIEPIYLEASNSAIPEVKRVVVMYNDRIAYEQTLGDCLEDLFGVSGGTVTTKTAKKDGKDGEPSGEDGGAPAADPGDYGKLAQEAYENAQKALKDGDWAKYGEYMEELEGYLNELAE